MNIQHPTQTKWNSKNRIYEFEDAKFILKLRLRNLQLKLELEKN